MQDKETAWPHPVVFSPKLLRSHFPQQPADLHRFTDVTISIARYPLNYSPRPGSITHRPDPADPPTLTAP